MKPRVRLLMALAIALTFTCCKKSSPFQPPPAGSFIFDRDGITDTLYGTLDTTSVYGYSVFHAAGQPHGYYYELDLMITVYNPTYSMKGTYWDTAYVYGPYAGSGVAVSCQLYAPNNINTGYNFSFGDSGGGPGQPFSLHVVSNTGNNIQATFYGRLYAPYGAASATFTEITNGRLNVNY